MKKITIILSGLFWAIAVFAQTPEITSLWEHSVKKDGVVPEWMATRTERSIAYYDGRIYISSVNSNPHIIVADPETGLDIFSETIDLPTDVVTGGANAINCINITPTGKIFLNNLTTDTKTTAFKCYLLTPKTESSGYDITTVINWTNPDAEKGYRLDFTAVYGDFTAGSNGYILAASTAMDVLRWDITNGVIASNPVIIPLQSLHPLPAEGDPSIYLAGVFQPVDQNRFLMNAAGMHPTMYNMEGQIIETFNGIVAPQMVKISGISHFNFKERSFVICGSGNYAEGVPPNTFEVFEILEGEYNFSNAAAVSGLLPTEGFGTQNNNTYQTAISVLVKEEEVLFYVMCPWNGWGGYKLTIPPSSVNNTKADKNITVFPLPASDILNLSEEMATVEIYNLTGQVVRKAFNVNKINVNDLNGSYILKAIDKDGQLVHKVIVVCQTH